VSEPDYRVEIMRGDVAPVIGWMKATIVELRDQMHRWPPRKRYYYRMRIANIAAAIRVLRTVHGCKWSEGFEEGQETGAEDERRQIVADLRGMARESGVTGAAVANGLADRFETGKHWIDGVRGNR
jgi:hypothetical protein